MRRLAAWRFALLSAIAALAFCAPALADTRWVVLSDIHFNPYGNAFDWYGADTTPALWSRTVTSLAAREGSADVVVVDGDLLAHRFESLVRKYGGGRSPDDAAIDVASRVARDLSGAFPRAQFVVTLGNNDDPCGDYRSENSSAFAERLAAAWEPLVNRNGRVPSFRVRFAHGGYYTVPVPSARASIIALNSVPWSIVYRGSCGGNSPRDAGGRELSWLEDRLRQLPGRSVIAMHIPPGYDPASTSLTRDLVAVPFLRPDRNGRFLRILARRRERVAFAIGAHLHRYAFRDAAGVPMLIVSSVSPVYRNFPAYFELRVDGGARVTSIRPFVYDPGSDDFQPRETFEQTFGMTAFTAAQLRDASARIFADPAARDRWIDAYDVWSPRMGDITDHDWRVYACSQVELQGGYGSCTRSLRLQYALWLALGAGGVVLAAAGFLVFTRRRGARPL